jgi:hypothetical protein
MHPNMDQQHNLKKLIDLGLGEKAVKSDFIRIFYGL